MAAPAGYPGRQADESLIPEGDPYCACYDPIAMSQSLSCVLIHVVFSTKNRHPFLADPNLRGELHAYVGGISRRLECPPIAIGGAEDHVHALFHLGRTVTTADWVKEVKRVSSMFAKGRARAFAWQRGYAAFSVDPSSMDRVAAYIRSQEEHHRKVSFQDELRQLLREHRLEWDERYLWE